MSSAWPQQISELTAVSVHFDDCLALAEPMPPVELSLLDALDCITAEDVHAPMSVPSFDNSSMDGYAVHAADLAGASQTNPVQLPVVGDVAAGSTSVLALAQGTSMRIMTGAPMPAGADAVVPVEATDGGIVRVQFTAPVVEGACIRRVGEDLEAGQLMMPAGTRITPRHVGLLANVGIAAVRALPRPRVVVLSTGTELVDPGCPLRTGQIYDSNGLALTAAALEAGAQAHFAGRVGDDEQAVRAALEDQLGFADLILTSGGVSAGAFDTVKNVLQHWGEVTFRKVAMQPGMPQGLGVLTGADRRRVPILTLPGNPVSSMVSFEMFVRPVIRKLRGEKNLHRASVKATAEISWSSPSKKLQLTRGLMTVHPDGARTVRPVGGAGSHLVHDLSEANVLIPVPAGKSDVTEGESLSCLLLNRPEG